jgi:hypothetical protein
MNPPFQISDSQKSSNSWKILTPKGILDLMPEPVPKPPPLFGPNSTISIYEILQLILKGFEFAE